MREKKLQNFSHFFLLFQTDSSRIRPVLCITNFFDAPVHLSAADAISIFGDALNHEFSGLRENSVLQASANAILEDLAAF